MTAHPALLQGVRRLTIEPGVKLLRSCQSGLPDSSGIFLLMRGE
jgi:hypothetical protein